ncbi:MAG: aminotransferase class V-fold PLP-dependent enzyme [Planctomycetota bacterium]|jgi:cysteine desulfurase/selenocysteine lyase
MDVAGLRRRFPALAGDAEAALDNAATTHRPQAVLDALVRFYSEDNANVHRAVHRRARAATEAYESARRRVARFLSAEPGEVVFTRNATGAINLVARSWVEPRVGPGRSIVVTALEHHSNLVPWQQVARRTGAELVVLPVDAQGRLAQPVALPENAAFLAATRVSNALGTIVDTDTLVAAAHAAGVPVLLDVTQAAGHLPLDEGSRAADFLALSAHKMYGPMGLGVLRGRAARLAEMEPVSFGGEMVTHVRARDADWQDPPLRFESGTPPVAEAAAFVAALDLIDEIGLPAIRAHELELLDHALRGLDAIEGVRVVGPRLAAERSGAISMTLSGDDPVLAATVLDLAGVAVRAGFHCAEPLLTGMGCGPTLRASVAMYTSLSDIDRLLAALPDAISASA